MSGPNSPTLPNERTYLFISDPGHKENLSGRVRAACMTCRRKKIKCSGEINCRTCREKGLVCEGMPERKRPRRDGGSIILDPVSSGGIDRKRRISTTKTARPRPSLSDLKHITPNGSEDSGYASTQPQLVEGMLSRATSQPNESTFETQVASGSKVTSIRSAQSAMPLGLRVDTWRLDPEPSRHKASPTFDTSHIRPPSEISPGAQPSSAVIEPSPVDWAQFKENEPWWTNNPTDDAPALISTARALEEQAQSLRLMANRQQSANDTQDMLARRQTIAFPLPTPGGLDGHYDVLPNQHGIFDDMALLLANRTPGTGMTPGLNDFSSWWDINAGDLMLSPGQSIQNMNLGQQQPNIFLDTPTSQAAPDLSQHQTSQDGYFGQFWPE
ncbi:hypothetical protein PRZ48_001794 [Zasmidium cellare]|uniref:Zn(2)-C6 fungal-type domain-containing protein n=1 Tax=Zasmidium cellare TaxID=395010 RepID=A0ABR0F2Y1_ZASCE|nr:hypothetical protein PRZ48_001794 [Zasmidium cellare]